MGAPVTALRRDCDADPGPSDRCRGCGGGRLVRHPELFDLTIAHVDCDAFFASVEKRDRPELAARPVIVGGGARGVVSTACYIARMSGVRSAMPMFKALRACPDAVVIRPDFAKYTAASRQIRALMQALTPLVRMQSIDEATLDLAGTEALHGAPPAVVLARFARAVEREVGVSVSLGLARNPMTAKIAAGRDKPRGFAVLGGEAAARLAGEPVGILPGIGPAMARGLAAKGILRLADLQGLDDRAARARLGEDGPALARRARLEDGRAVRAGRETKSVSAETTFGADLSRAADLERALWLCAEKVAGRLRADDLAAGGVVLKLRTAAFATRTRGHRLSGATQLPDTLFAVAARLLAREVNGTAFRLIGLAAQPVVPAAGADAPDLADPDSLRRPARQRAIEALRARYGREVIRRGRALP